MSQLTRVLSLGILVLASAAALAQAPSAAAPSAAMRGKTLFQQKCQPCHGTEPSDMGRAMLPGTDALRIKYKGALPAALEQRGDLNYDVLRVFLRHGTWSMPPFRKTELSDADIADIAAYLVVSSAIARP